MQPEDLIAKKPVARMSAKEKKECLQVAQLLAKDWQDKYTLAEILGVSERAARDRISTIAKRLPVISTSDAKGYKIASSKADLETAKQAYAELKSRANEILLRAAILGKFIRKMEADDGTI